MVTGARVLMPVIVMLAEAAHSPRVALTLLSNWNASGVVSAANVVALNVAEIPAYRQDRAGRGRKLAGGRDSNLEPLSIGHRAGGRGEGTAINRVLAPGDRDRRVRTQARDGDLIGCDDGRQCCPGLSGERESIGSGIDRRRWRS